MKLHARRKMLLTTETRVVANSRNTCSGFFLIAILAPAEAFLIHVAFPFKRASARGWPSVLNHSTLEFRHFSKRAPGSWTCDRSTYF